jgi:hypothetical protein
MRVFFTSMVFIVLIGAIAAGSLAIESRQSSKQCLDQTTVAEILSLNYRRAEIRLADGRTTSVWQATLKPGDPMCIKWAL